MDPDRKLSMDELGRVDATTFKSTTKRPILLVLDDIRSRHNVGAIFRTADAFAIEGLVLCGFTPVPPHREIEKTALGATASVDWQHAPSVGDALRGLRNRGYLILCVEQTAQARELTGWRAGDRPVAFVLGNELSGVSDEAIALCDGALVIPQAGIKHSLNVGVCAGIVLWQAIHG